MKGDNDMNWLKKARLERQKADIDEEAKALSDFIGLSPMFDKLTPEIQEQLKERNDILWQYSEILQKSIASATE